MKCLLISPVVLLLGCSTALRQKPPYLSGINQEALSTYHSAANILDPQFVTKIYKVHYITATQFPKIKHQLRPILSSTGICEFTQDGIKIIDHPKKINHAIWLLTRIDK